MNRVVRWLPWNFEAAQGNLHNRGPPKTDTPYIYIHNPYSKAAKPIGEHPHLVMAFSPTSNFVRSSHEYIYIYIYSCTVPTLKYMMGGRDNAAPEVVQNRYDIHMHITYYTDGSLEPQEMDDEFPVLWASFNRQMFVSEWTWHTHKKTQGCMWGHASPYSNNPQRIFCSNSYEFLQRGNNLNQPNEESLNLTKQMVV